MQNILALLFIAAAANADNTVNVERESGVASLKAAYAARAAGKTRAAEKVSVTPVEKVIQLLQGMVEKGKKEKHEESVQYNSYKQWCDETTVEKTRRIKEANELIEQLQADIQKYAADAALLSKEIAVHDEDIATWKNDIKAATKVREIEKADYDASHQDYTESIDALERAIQVLKKSAGDKKQASFAQVSTLKTLNLIPEDAKRAIDTFFQDADEALVEAAPEANAYEYQSHGIIDMLEKLLNKFVDELRAMEEEEGESLHAFTMLMQDMDAQIEDSTARRDEKAAEKAKKLQAKAEAEGTVEDTTATRDDDAKYLADVTAQCEKKASDFAERQQLRADEIVALEKAIEILSSDSVSGAAEKHLPTMLQKKSASASLAQLRSDGRNPSQVRVAEYLSVKSKEIGSRVLATLAVRVGNDPFKKVRKMIKDLITRLQEEAAEEAQHKDWCDTELATNEQTRKEKTEQVEMLHAEIDELEASIAKLTEEITDLIHAIQDLDAAVKKATEIRQAEKAKNTETIADAKEAQDAVAKATAILKEFYAKAGEATALMQQPEVFDSPYKGNQAGAGGVLGMLEVIASDFTRLEAETSAAEEAAQKEYDEFMADAETDKTQKTRDIERNTKKKQDHSQSLEEKKKDIDGTSKELTASIEYYHKLKPDCIDSGVSYEERVARRKEEIESLQEALRILNGEDIA
jgi:hypothetical protein